MPLQADCGSNSCPAQDLSLLRPAGPSGHSALGIERSIRRPPTAGSRQRRGASVTGRPSSTCRPGGQWPLSAHSLESASVLSLCAVFQCSAGPATCGGGRRLWCRPCRPHAGGAVTLIQHPPRGALRFSGINSHGRASPPPRGGPGACRQWQGARPGEQRLLRVWKPAGGTLRLPQCQSALPGPSGGSRGPPGVHLHSQRTCAA